MGSWAEGSWRRKGRIYQQIAIQMTTVSHLPLPPVKMTGIVIFLSQSTWLKLHQLRITHILKFPLIRQILLHHQQIKDTLLQLKLHHLNQQINHQIKKRRKKFASFFFWCGLNILVRWCASKLWFIDQGHDIIKLLLYVLVLEIMIIGYGTPRVINQNWLNF